jgi:N-acetyl-gamma-glutamyl-phosphate reductase
MNRGILSTIYIPLAGGAAEAGPPDMPPSKELLQRAGELRDLWADFYRDEPFVRVLPAGAAASTRGVRQSNYCDISVHLDQTGTTLIVVSAIDNMVKGAAGQAVQNMNIIFGFDERIGLEALPAAF